LNDNVEDVKHDDKDGTNLETLSDSKVIHFYNQRGEDSENRFF
jgi:hypothetical protein